MVAYGEINIDDIDIDDTPLTNSDLLYFSLFLILEKWILISGKHILRPNYLKKV